MRHTVLGWIVIGLIAGWLTGKLSKGSGFGLLGNLFLGPIGAVIGGWICGQLGIAWGGSIGSIAAERVGWWNDPPMSDSP